MTFESVQRQAIEHAAQCRRVSELYCYHQRRGTIRTCGTSVEYSLEHDHSLVAVHSEKLQNDLRFSTSPNPGDA